MSFGRPALAALFVLFLPISVALAGPFFDVPDDHPYIEALKDLKQRGVVTGDKNADGSAKGTVRPEDDLNRAELLALAYRAAGKEIRSIYRGCFPDAEGWFEDLVCTAKQNGDVQGHPDGRFHPGDPVNNVAMLKIVLNALGFAIPTLTLENKVGLDYKNVNINSWYAPYLLAAVIHALLPPELTAGNDFHPDAFPSRGLAAEVIHRALQIPPGERGSIPDTVRQHTAVPEGMTLIEVPFDRKGRTGERGALAFLFDLEEKSTVLITTENDSSSAVGLECFLYLLNASNLPDEIFMGFREGAKCFIRAALQPGRYQLEMRAGEAGEVIALQGVFASGDGNDGYGEAVALERATPVHGILEGEGPDYEDWFRFTMASTATRVVNLTADAELRCTVVPSFGVDLPSFDSPHCREPFEYPPGIYYVSVQRAAPATATQEYTIEVR